MLLYQPLRNGALTPSSGAAFHADPLLWTECAPLKLMCWKLTPCDCIWSWDLWEADIKRVEPSWMGSVPLSKRPRMPPPPCEESVGRQPSMHQKAGSNHKPNPLVPRSWTSQAPEMWGINLVYKPPCLQSSVRAAQMGWDLGPRPLPRTGPAPRKSTATEPGLSCTGQVRKDNATGLLGMAYTLLLSPRSLGWLHLVSSRCKGQGGTLDLGTPKTVLTCL